MNVIAEVVGSWWLALIFQVSHVISEVCMYVMMSQYNSTSLMNVCIHTLVYVTDWICENVLSTHPIFHLQLLTECLRNESVRSDRQI